MVYIIDTHSLIWYLTGDERIGKNAKRILLKLESGQDQLIISVIVFLETLALIEKGKLTFTWEEFNAKVGQFPTAIIYPIGLDIVREIKNIGKFLELHDRILVTTTKIHRGVLITKDKEIKKAKIKTTW